MPRLHERFRGMAYAMVSKKPVHEPLRRLARHGLIPQAIWTRLPAIGIVDIAVNDTASILYQASANDFMDRVYFWSGLSVYEGETFPLFFRLASKARTVLDIGAHSGMYTLLACAASAHSQVISFEPIPYIHDRLVANITLNGWQDRCTTFQAAVSDTGGSAQMHVSPRREIHSSLCEGWDECQEEILLDISVTTVDEACAGRKGIDLVKLDVEGYEDRALEGMRRVLGEERPSIVVECLPHGPTMAVQQILDEYSYRYYHLTHGGIIPMSEIVPDQEMRDRNYLCTARDIPWLPA